MTGRPVKFPGAQQAPLTAPPTLGQDTMHVLRDILGCNDDTLNDLAGKGVIKGAENNTAREPDK